ncbi:CPBP family glutamic-type intramembrane protease [Actinokineospora sp.]|uniref:CPBP family glutamic-type intramembrane protease n=1 Tax=Actinokineospora sp. TaxID=1872133 RepID=UPI0040382762
MTLGSAAAVFAAGTAAGLLRWTTPDLAALAAFVLVNGLTAVRLEALPEELALRGYAWTALRERHRAAVATLVTTALFLLVPGGSMVVHAAITPSPIGFVPRGEDPLSYLILLVVFGLTLIAARTATASASLWTSVGTHLTVLTVNRIALFGDERGAGWSAEAGPEAVLLVPVYLCVAALAFLVIRRGSRRKRPADRSAAADRAA